MQVACDVPVWATIGGQDVERLPSASTCYNTLKVDRLGANSFLDSVHSQLLKFRTNFDFLDDFVCLVQILFSCTKNIVIHSNLYLFIGCSFPHTSVQAR